ncbi:MAG: DNA topoisomerase I [Proteobacteria bacterium]|nr:DNA topoisomerase I [Pseudomonadota bacterium]MDA0992248.1 DNA topoisomerase I [Pseudomonadota bacterium]
MAKNLVIVESPAKATTISKYLGKDFEVLASYGHVRDLVPKEGAVDPEQGFAMKYQVIERNEKHVKAIIKALKGAEALYLATDPDREGEAISWHLIELLKERKALGDRAVHRVVFHEITKDAVRAAVASPRAVSDDLVSAQQARRALDYLVGFNLSPLLWKKVQRGLSAGRVQSPALRMIVERELEIEAFKAREYWSIEADVSKEKQAFLSRLVRYKGEKVEQFSFENESAAREVEKTIIDAASGKMTAVSVDKKQRRRNPAAPFTTSTLQQESSRKLGFNTQWTMRLAQRLYEGIELPDVGNVGLITYMRTDSVTLADVAVAEIRDVIKERYGAVNVPDEPRAFKNKSKNAQEAHEAIRPTSVALTPESLKGKLDEEQLRLYTLIWKRTMACQMVPAVFDTVALEFAVGATDPASADEKHRFRANGSVLVEPGFMAVYHEGKDDSSDDDGDRLLPDISVGDVIDLDLLRTEQHFTEPPPRFTEASLVKTLEEYGIGRPSTYASIIGTLKTREYVDMDAKRFLPTDIGRIVIGFLTEHFAQYVDYDFTARLEDDLDAISLGEKDLVPLLENFWLPFHELVVDKENSVTREQVAQARELGTDPKSGKPVTVRMGRYGPFVQIGTKDDEEKPKFAGLRPGQKMNDIDLASAMELFKLPRALGETADGLPVAASVGRFGPYVRYGDKYVSIKDEDPYTIELPRALELIEEKMILDANRIIHDFEAEGIQVLNGRYGPYVTDKTKNARIPKDREPKSLTLEECVELLANAPVRGKRGKKKVAKKASEKKAPKKKTTKKKAAKKKAAKKKPAKTKATRKTPADKQPADPGAP